MDKDCGNKQYVGNLGNYLLNGKLMYDPGMDERRLGDGYADEDDPRKLGWCGEPIDDNEQDFVIENHGSSHTKKRITEQQVVDYMDRNNCTRTEAETAMFRSRCVEDKLGRQAIATAVESFNNDESTEVEEEARRLIDAGVCVPIIAYERANARFGNKKASQSAESTTVNSSISVDSIGSQSGKKPESESQKQKRINEEGWAKVQAALKKINS